MTYQMEDQKGQCPWHVSQSSCDVLDPLSPIRIAASHSPEERVCSSQMSIK